MKLSKTGCHHCWRLRCERPVQSASMYESPTKSHCFEKRAFGANQQRKSARKVLEQHAHCSRRAPECGRYKFAHTSGACTWTHGEFHLTRGFHNKEYISTTKKENQQRHRGRHTHPISWQCCQEKRWVTNDPTWVTIECSWHPKMNSVWRRSQTFVASTLVCPSHWWTQVLGRYDSGMPSPATALHYSN
jgi:hypothetical protein